METTYAIAVSAGPNSCDDPEITWITTNLPADALIHADINFRHALFFAAFDDKYAGCEDWMERSAAFNTTAELIQYHQEFNPIHEWQGVNLETIRSYMADMTAAETVEGRVKFLTYLFSWDPDTPCIY